MRRSMIRTYGRCVLAAIVAVGVTAKLSPVWADDTIEQEIVVVNDDDESGDSDVPNYRFTPTYDFTPPLKTVVINDESGDSGSDAKLAEPPKLWLGVALKEVEGDLARYVGEVGVLVNEVVEDSPAANAGIEEGDILLRMEDTELSQPRELIDFMRELAVDDAPKSLKVTLLRKGEKKTLEVTPRKRPALGESQAYKARTFAVDSEGMLNEEAIEAGLKFLDDVKHSRSLNVFRFGRPSVVWINEKMSGDLNIVIKRNVNGEEVEVEVTRKDDGPAKITVKRGDDVQEFTEENMDEMDADVSEIGKWIVTGNENMRVSFDDLDVNWQDLRLTAPVLADGKAMIERAEKQYGAKMREMAARARESARRVRKAAREAAEMPAEMEELRALVEELRAEVQTLRAKLDEFGKP